MCCVFVLKGMEGVPRGDARGPEGAVVELKGAEGVSTPASAVVVSSPVICLRSLQGLLPRCFVTPLIPVVIVMCFFLTTA